MHSQTQSIELQHKSQKSIRQLTLPQQYKSQDQRSNSSETKNSQVLNLQPKKENCSSKIWPNIGASKPKQVKEVIQIQEKSSASQVDSTQNVTQQYLPTTLEKPYYIVETRPKEDYWNKDSIQANELYLKDETEQKQNSLILQAQMQRLFPNKDQNSQEQKTMMTMGLDLLMTKHSSQPGKSNIIRLVQLLYKKYVVVPVKQAYCDTQQADIFKPELIRGQKYYAINDNSLKNQNKQTISQAETVNTFKRSQPARAYGQISGFSVDNQSTNSNGEYYQNIQNMANNYVNVIRKERTLDPQQRPNLPQRHPPERKPPVRPELALPFDIQIPQHTARKQFNPGFNLFQSADQDKNQRFEEQRTIAKTFVKDGYGLQIVRNYMPNIDGGGYNRAITTIIRESYKKIEDFLLKQCNIKIHSLTSSEFSLVKTPLVHCRNILTDEDRSTFFKYIAITYKFGKMRQDIFPTADQTLRLYKAIVRGLNERRAAKELNPPKPIKEKDMYFSR